MKIKYLKMKPLENHGSYWGIQELGKSHGGRPINAFHFAYENDGPAKNVLVLGGVHGDEREGVWLVEAIIKKWQKSFPLISLNAWVIPYMNPDGVALNKRVNGNEVDINRNHDTKDWQKTALKPKYPPGAHPNSEPETQILAEFIKNYEPIGIISLHSFNDPQINANGDKDKTQIVALAEYLAEVSPYKKITYGDGMGYPTPGCLGTYSGYELGIPTITFELFRGEKKKTIVRENVPVIEAFVRFCDANLR